MISELRAILAQMTGRTGESLHRVVLALAKQQRSRTEVASCPEPTSVRKHEQDDLLREGYIALAGEARAINKEWEAVDAEWPD